MAEQIRIPKFILFKEIRFPTISNVEWLTELTTEFKPRDSDIFVCTYPRSGTTWLQHILGIMKSQAKLDDMIFQQSPFIELPFFETREEADKHFPNRNFPLKGEIDCIPAPIIFKSHLPHFLIPKNPKAKYIYCFRNPKDNVISCYHHTCGKKMFEYDGTFNDYFEIYTKGHVEDGSWFDHVIGWWEHRDDPNVLTLSYEELQMNFKEKVYELSAFTGLKMTEELFELIEKETNFEAMKANDYVSFQSTIKSRQKEDDAHIRKGVVGEWKNMLTPEQNRIIDDLIECKLKGNSLRDKLIFEV